MYYKVVSVSDWEAFYQEVCNGSLPELKYVSKDFRRAYTLLAESLGEQILILKEFYGDHRDAEKDLGGEAYCFASLRDYELFYEKVKQFHNIMDMPSEYADVIANADGVEMVQELFIISSDFAVLMIYVRQSEEDYMASGN